MIQCLFNETVFTCAKRRIRHAVTLVEVIFAVGVVLIGLLGLMSILPLAGRRAEDSISLNTSAAMAESIMDDLLSRRFLAKGQLRRFSRSDMATSPVGSDTPVNSVNSFVIDPMFCSGYEADNGAIPSINPITPTSNGYDQVLFPYYKRNHNPYGDPSSSTSTTWLTLQPRMHRVGIANTSTAASSRAFIDREQALALSESRDDLDVFRPKDRSRPATFKALQGVSGGLLYGKRVPKGRYSWFATVNPLSGGRYASVSVVVVRDRERSFTAPTTTAGAAEPEDNAVGERLAYVTYASGFRGGAGGVVHINGSLATVSRLRSNSWLMLSRTDSGSGVVVHRWYRVAGVDGRAEELAGSWRHKLLLDGPDWNFGFADSSGNQVAYESMDAWPLPASGVARNTLDNTYVTLVDGVVSVTERTVLISDL